MKSGKYVHNDEDNFITQVNLFQSHLLVLNTRMFFMQKSRLREVKMQYPEKITVGHLNINSIRKIFDALSFIIDTNIDILLISESKLDDSFSSAQFRLKGLFTPYRLDRNSKGGGLLLHLRDGFQFRFLNSG